MAERPLPAWIEIIVSRLAAMLALNEWQIHLHPENAAERPDGNEGCDGLTSFSASYRTAKIFLDRDIDPDRSGFELITHEVLHVVLADMHTAVGDILAFTPPEHRDTLSAIYDRVEEQIVNRLARGMARDFDMGQWLPQEHQDE